MSKQLFSSTLILSKSMISQYVIKPQSVGTISSDKDDNGNLYNHVGYNYFVGHVQYS